MRYLSVCSGIEACSTAWHTLGWTPAGFSEIEAFPRALLQERFGAQPVDWDHRHSPQSNVLPMFGDFTQIEAHHVGPIDLLVGGTPCQAFSIAGKRLGLDDPRGNLTLEFLALARRLRPRWLLWENVPGVLSDDSGRTMGTFLGLVGELGYRGCYRVLDAQFVRVDGFGRAVPQRRRRVFFVGYLGDDSRAFPVLFEPESLRGNPAPRRQAGQGTAGDVAPSLVSSGRGVERAGETRGQDPVVAVAVGPTMQAGGNGTGGDRPYGTTVDTCDSLVAHPLAPPITSNPYGDHESRDGLLVAHTLKADGFDASEDGPGRGTPIVPVLSGAICKDSFTGGMGGRPEGAASGHCIPIAFSSKDHGADASTELAPTLRSMGHDGSHANGGGQMAVALGWAFRRLTPIECERLQGFPDGHTAITYRGKPAADGPRYKAIGNSMAVNVMRWIGMRIQWADDAAGANEIGEAA